MLLYVSLGFNAVFVLLLLGALFLLGRAGRIIQEYETFYEQTLKGLEEHLHYVQRLLRESVILSNDESVQRVYRAIKVFHSMLAGYANARNQAEEFNLKREPIE